MWNCVETEVVEENFLRRRERELIFDNVYESETALRKHNPIRVTKENIKVIIHVKLKVTVFR